MLNSTRIILHLGKKYFSLFYHDNLLLHFHFFFYFFFFHFLFFIFFFYFFLFIFYYFFYFYLFFFIGLYSWLLYGCQIVMSTFSALGMCMMWAMCKYIYIYVYKYILLYLLICTWLKRLKDANYSIFVHFRLYLMMHLMQVINFLCNWLYFNSFSEL